MISSIVPFQISQQYFSFRSVSFSEHIQNLRMLWQPRNLSMFEIFANSFADGCIFGHYAKTLHAPLPFRWWPKILSTFPKNQNFNVNLYCSKLNIFHFLKVWMSLSKGLPTVNERNVNYDYKVKRYKEDDTFLESFNNHGKDFSFSPISHFVENILHMK